MRVKLKLDRLIQEISQSSLSQNHWAMKLGLSRGHLSGILNGKHPYLSARTRQRIVDGLSIPFDDLFEVERGDDWTYGSSADFQSALYGRYVIDRELGHGGMGTVYLARDVKHGRNVAIKVISPEVVQGVGAEQFLKEIRYTSRLEHPNILSLHDSGEAASYPYYIMPYIREGSLQARLQDRGRLSLAETVAVIQDVAKALEHAHSNRILHCDIKPANILLAEDHAYLADFGISRAIHAEAREWQRRGEIDSSAGTPAYVSPEQASGDADLDARTDTYSLACVAFEMLAGQPPFGGSTTMEIVSKRFTDIAPNVRDFVPDVPLAVAAVIEKSMSLLSSRRHDTAKEFAQELERAAFHRSGLVQSVSLFVSLQMHRIQKATGQASPANYVGRGALQTMDLLLKDLQFAWRSWRKRPGLAMVAVLTLAIGIGVNTGMFSLVNGVFLRGSSMEHRGELVDIWRGDDSGNLSFVSRRDYENVRDRSEALFMEVTSHKWFTGQVEAGDGRPTVVLGNLVNANYFTALGVIPAIGRSFLAEEDATRNTHPVVILSWSLWRTEFGADTTIVGNAVRLNGRAYTVVGIMPQSFHGRVPAPTVDVWVPIAMEDHLYPASYDSNNRALTARLAPGVSVSQVESVLEAVATGVDEETGRQRFWFFSAIHYDDFTFAPQFDGIMSAIAILLLVVVGLVLAITCANLASFFLARATERRREIALRLALGATRGRLIRQLVTESLSLGLIGGAAGIVVASILVQLLLRFEPPLVFPINIAVGLDYRVLGYTLVVTLLAGVVFGLVPALKATRADLAPTLRGEESLTPVRSLTLRDVLVIGQIGLSLVLLIGAGLFLRSLQAALNVDVGFDTSPAAVISIDARGSGYEEDEYGVLYQQVREAVEAVPEVRSLAVTDRLPLALGNSSINIVVPGLTNSRGGSDFQIEIAVVSFEYFDILGLQADRGRLLTSGDHSEAARVAVMNQSAAERFWPWQDPVNRIIQIGGEDVTIVGVVQDAKVRSLNESPVGMLFLPASQRLSSLNIMHFIAKGPTQPRELAETIRVAALSVDPDLFVQHTNTLEDRIGVMYFLPRMAALIVSSLAVLAICLAMVGLYGVISYAVSMRTREMGIRLSLGAKTGDVVRLVLFNGARLGIAGGVLGLVLALGGARMIRGLLVGVSSIDAATFAGSIVLLTLVTALATFIPARRASRVNPLDAIRTS